jgi:hypothetical protein
MSQTHPQTRNDAEISASKIEDQPIVHRVAKTVNGVTADDDIDVKGEVIGESVDEDGYPHHVVAHTHPHKR